MSRSPRGDWNEGQALLGENPDSADCCGASGGISRNPPGFPLPSL